MPRDTGLEELVKDELGNPAGLSGKAMFGGWAFLLHGNLLCGVRRGGLMLRIGSQKEEWALAQRGVVPVVMRGRRIRGYVRAGAEACADDGIRQSLLQAALVFTRSLPKKQPQSR